MPEGVFTVVEYPREINGVSVSALWDTVMRRTPYEASTPPRTAWRRARSRCRRRPICASSSRRSPTVRPSSPRGAAAAGRLRSLKSERERTVERVARQHEGRSNGSPLSAKAAASVQSMLDSLDGHLAEAADELEQAIADGGADAPEGARSAVDLLLDLVFEAAPRPLWAAPAEFAVEMAQRQGELRRMWASTFGRLPAASSARSRTRRARPPSAAAPAARRAARAAAAERAGGAVGAGDARPRADGARGRRRVERRERAPRGRMTRAVLT